MCAKPRFSITALGVTPSTRGFWSRIGRATRAHFVSTAWTAVALHMLGGCSTRSETTPEKRAAASSSSEGLSVGVELRRVQRSHSAGLREAGRWFGWESASVECDVVALLSAKKDGASPLDRSLALETDPPKRLSMDAEHCKQRFQNAVVSACASKGRVVVDIDGVTSAVSSIGDRIFQTSIEKPGSSCEATLAAQPDASILAALSGEPEACPTLLDRSDAKATTLCMINYRSWVGSSATKESLVALVERAGKGEKVDDAGARWAARVAKGKDDPLDLEAALYAVLLLDGAEAERFDAGKNVEMGLAFTPSRARRVTFIEAGLARCGARTVTAWQKAAIATAVGPLSDDALSARLRTSCGIDPIPADIWLGSHLR